MLPTPPLRLRRFRLFAPALLVALAGASCAGAKPPPPPNSAKSGAIESAAVESRAALGQIPAAARPHAYPSEPGQQPELRYPRSSRPWLGVELIANDPPAAGVLITRVLPGSPAERAALQAGDRLVRLGETDVQDPVAVSEWVAGQALGGSHPVLVLRAGEERLFRAELDGMPEFEDRMRLALVNRPAPEISGVATFQGNTSSLAELRGQVVILEFWASYCGACRLLGPRLDAWHRAYQSRGAQVVGITVDPPRLGLEVAGRTGMTYVLASDVGGRVSHSYQASQIPSVIIIDRRGIVRDAMVGYSEHRLKETTDLIESLLAASP